MVQIKVFSAPLIVIQSGDSVIVKGTDELESHANSWLAEVQKDKKGEIQSVQQSVRGEQGTGFMVLTITYTVPESEQEAEE
jgi:hypothetical protein